MGDGGSEFGRTESCRHLGGNDWRYRSDWNYMKSLAQCRTASLDSSKAEANPQSPSAVSCSSCGLRYPLPLGEGSRPEPGSPVQAEFPAHGPKHHLNEPLRASADFGDRSAL
jgi:hypothetical protein